MRLFHVSEESGIKFFKPRIPTRSDLDKSDGLVWAVDELRLPSFLTPRDCPRVTYHIGQNTKEDDIKKYFTSPTATYTVVIENKWFEIMRNTSLYLYEFDTNGFKLQDSIAGYYIAKTPQRPIAIFKTKNLFNELFERNVELRIVDNLWKISEEIKRTTLNWSLCKMGFAQPR